MRSGTAPGFFALGPRPDEKCLQLGDVFGPQFKQRPSECLIFLVPAGVDGLIQREGRAFALQCAAKQGLGRNRGYQGRQLFGRLAGISLEGPDCPLRGLGQRRRLALPPGAIRQELSRQFLVRESICSARENNDWINALTSGVSSRARALR